MNCLDCQHCYKKKELPENSDILQFGDVDYTNYYCWVPKTGKIVQRIAKACMDHMDAAFCVSFKRMPEFIKTWKKKISS